MKLMQSKTAAFFAALLVVELAARALAHAGLLGAGDVAALHETVLLFGGGFAVKESVTNYATKGATSGYAAKPGGVA